MPAAAGENPLHQHLARLEQGAACLSATRRLQRYLREEFQRHMEGRGAEAWPSPDILPWDAWLERAWRDAEFGGEGALLLNDVQELALWEEAIADADGSSPLWRKSEAARAARAAHRALADWQLDEKCLHNGSDDARAFAGWRENFMRRCRGENWLDRVAMQKAILARGELPAPPALIVAGFDVATPLMKKILARCEGGGAEVVQVPLPKNSGDVRLCRAADPEEELHRAASWCREQIEKNDAGFSVGVVVRDLEKRREDVRRIFTDVLGGFDPVVDRMAAERLFHLSLGAPLDVQPLVADALDLLEWTSAECDYETFSRWLRSPFTKGAEAELAARARVDFALRESLPPTVTPTLLRRVVNDERFMKKKFAGDAPQLSAMLRNLCGGGEPKKFSMGEWGAEFSRRLKQANWPGDATLNSHEHQAHEAWKEMLDNFASLDLVAGACGARAAFVKLRRLAAARVFNPQAVAAPVQVMGLAESAGLTFDALWAAGFDHASWPPPPSPLAFLPVRAQRERGMPGGGWDESLNSAQQLTARLKAAAPAVVFSYAELDDDRELRPSALLLSDDVKNLDAPEKPHLHPAHLGAACAHLETVDDSRGAALPPHVPAPGGAGLFRDQSQCPFRAYASRRLGGKGLPEPRAAANAMDRGNLVHQAMRLLWGHWRGRDELRAEGGAALESKVNAALDKTLGDFQRRNPSVLGANARQALAGQLRELILRHLAFEKQRPPFTVTALEEKCEEIFHGLSLRVWIDRIDRLDDGSLLVMDYKTGDAKTTLWDGGRPEEPQLPLYRALLGDEVKAIAFARIRVGETDGTRLAGRCGTAQGAECGLKNDNWESKTAEWNSHLEELAREIATGVARVAPARGEATCRYCDLHAVCRVDEHRLDGGGGENGDG